MIRYIWIFRRPALNGLFTLQAGRHISCQFFIAGRSAESFSFYGRHCCRVFLCGKIPAGNEPVTDRTVRRRIRSLYLGIFPNGFQRKPEFIRPNRSEASRLSVSALLPRGRHIGRTILFCRLKPVYRISRLLRLPRITRVVRFRRTQLVSLAFGLRRPQPFLRAARSVYRTQTIYGLAIFCDLHGGSAYEHHGHAVQICHDRFRRFRIGILKAKAGLPEHSAASEFILPAVLPAGKVSVDPVPERVRQWSHPDLAVQNPQEITGAVLPDFSFRCRGLCLPAEPVDLQPPGTILQGKYGIIFKSLQISKEPSPENHFLLFHVILRELRPVSRQKYFQIFPLLV